MPANYPDWIIGVTPHTHADATATRFRTVTSVQAIRVQGATYRASRPIDGVFELVTSSPQQVDGDERYEVYCAWFGVKPFTRYPRVRVGRGKYELLSSYSGEVIDNLSVNVTD